MAIEDFQIVDLYWERSQSAIIESDKKYGKLLFKISYSLLDSKPDSEECVNDTYLAAWNRMPTERPVFLGAFLSKIVRNISVDRFRKRNATKRGRMAASLDELEECFSDGYSVEGELENTELRELLNRFISGLDAESRVIFVKRYFFSKEISEIAKETGFSQGKIKSSLFRRRAELANILKEAGKKV